MITLGECPYGEAYVQGGDWQGKNPGDWSWGMSTCADSPADVATGSAGATTAAGARTSSGSSASGTSDTGDTSDTSDNSSESSLLPWVIGLGLVGGGLLLFFATFGKEARQR